MPTARAKQGSYRPHSKVFAYPVNPDGLLASPVAEGEAGAKGAVRLKVPAGGRYWLRGEAGPDAKPDPDLSGPRGHNASQPLESQRRDGIDPERLLTLTVEV